ncbi:MAG: DUF2608 domain-containing protein, partial [Leptospiraceae bacterium]|nr:DUF2608 domain-containing protein [Leptospiraceae bacterium]
MLKNCYRIFFLFFIFIKNFLLAEIIEVKSFHEILNYLPSQKQASVFFVFDIDDTLLNTKQMLGSDQWFLDRISIYQKMQYPVQEAFEKTLAEWEGVRHLTQMELVEDQINNIIAQMQEKHATILGLT